ncbi:MAG: phosphoglucosamine mutase [Desulfurococcaceae archaeon TW002]
MKLFGTDGVRGVINEDLKPEFVVRLALAIATYFGSGSSILVGRDSRAGSELIKDIVSGVLVSSGLRVYDAGLTPTPALQYNVKERGFDGGIMVTASHNPPQYSGIKVVLPDGIEAPREVEEEIEKIFSEESFRRVPWRELRHRKILVDDVNEFYVEGIIKHIDTDKLKKTFKVVVDPANNVGALTTPKLLRMLGVKVLTINSDLTHQPFREPEPTQENLEYLSNIVRDLRADFAVAHDGDADRAIFIDNLGRYMSGDRSAALLCKHIVVNKRIDLPRRVVTAVSSSTIVEDLLREYGVEVVWVRVSSIVIARTMQRLGAMAGFEENGGFFYAPHQMVRDGAMTTALMLELLSSERASLSDLYDSLPRRHLIKTKVPLRDKSLVSNLIDKILLSYSNYRSMTIDGVKIIGPDFWFIVRPSGTEPVIRIFVEAGDESKANEILKDLLGITSEVLR